MGKRLKERLTITLNHDIVEALDATIDGKHVLNRSHAIELILSERLGSNIRRAIIFAGGAAKDPASPTGTSDTPKALLTIDGKPLLQHILEQIREAGITDITIVTHAKSDAIQERFGDGLSVGVHLTYIRQNGQGTASALSAVSKKLDQPFLLYYGDILTNIDLKKFLNFHRTHRGIGSVALAASQNPESYGVVGLDGSLIRSFREKPHENAVGLVNAGIFIFNSNVTDYLRGLPEGAKLEDTVLPRLAREKQLHGYPFEAAWFDIGTPSAYERARAIFRPTMIHPQR